VFPRPKNISEAYGGGRNLPPGKALESEVASKEREARVSAKLKEYRKAMGLEIDPAVEAQAQVCRGLALQNTIPIAANLCRLLGPCCPVLLPAWLLPALP
jgi:hypothetical protein